MFGFYPFEKDNIYIYHGIFIFRAKNELNRK